MSEASYGNFRKVTFPPMDEILVMQPMKLSEMGGADYVRYLLRTTEIRELLADFLDYTMDVEGDGEFFGEASAHKDKFAQFILEAQRLFDRLMPEAREAREVMDPR